MFFVEAAAVKNETAAFHENMYRNVSKQGLYRAPEDGEKAGFVFEY
jgi:hypothetical protein